MANNTNAVLHYGATKPITLDDWQRWRDVAEQITAAAAAGGGWVQIPANVETHIFVTPGVPIRFELQPAGRGAAPFSA